VDLFHWQRDFASADVQAATLGVHAAWIASQQLYSVIQIVFHAVINSVLIAIVNAQLK
jgi:hypothetical protein